jgi:hypothetical protein
MLESYGTLANKTLVCPGRPDRLPGQHWFEDHCEGAPSASKGGVNECMVRLGTRRLARENFLRDIVSAMVLTFPAHDGREHPAMNGCEH